MNLTQFITVLAGAFIVVSILFLLLFFSGFWDEKTVEDLEKDYPDFFVETTVLVTSPVNTN